MHGELLLQHAAFINRRRPNSVPLHSMTMYQPSSPTIARVSTGRPFEMNRSRLGWLDTARPSQREPGTEPAARPSC